MSSSPPPVSDVEKNLPRDYHRARWWSVTAVLVAMIGIVAYLAATLGAQRGQIETQQAQLRAEQNELQSSCGFYRLLGLLDPASATSGAKPGLTGVTIVLDARTAYKGQECEPALPSASPSLRHWAAFYHLPVG